jgi:hydrogenase maturation protease
MKTLVLGLGNSILTDDSAGLYVAEELKERVPSGDVTILKTELGGLNLLEFLIGYDRAIIVDAIQTAQGIPGTIYQFKPESGRGSLRINSTHSINFADSLELGKKMGMALPQEIIILAIEALDVHTFSAKCTPEVNRAIPVCADTIARMILEPIPENHPLASGSLS